VNERGTRPRAPLRPGRRAVSLQPRYGLGPAKLDAGVLAHAVGECFIAQVELVSQRRRPERFVAGLPLSDKACMHSLRSALLGQRLRSLAHQVAVQPMAVEPERGGHLTQVRLAAGPAPSVERFHQAGRDRVAFHIPAQRQQIGVAINQDRLEPPLEPMTDQAMPPVEGLGVDAVRMPHQPRQVALACVQHEVMVVAHLTVGVHLGVEPVHGRRQHVQLQQAVGIVAIDGLAPVTPRGDVVDGAGELDAEVAAYGWFLGERGDLTPSSP
jgi:hypothetical protein